MKRPTHFILIFRAEHGGTTIRNEVAYSLKEALKISDKEWKADKTQRVIVTQFVEEHKPEVEK